VAKRVWADLLLPALQSGCAVNLDLSDLPERDASLWHQLMAMLQEAREESEGLLSVSVTAAHPESEWFCSQPLTSSRKDVCIQIRYGRQVQPVPASAVRPLSSLHSKEKGQVIMPLGQFDVPARSAWLTLEIDALHLGNPAQLRLALGRCLRFADNLIDMIDWPQPSLRLDALLNRRVAVHLKNIGDRVLADGLDPASPVTFGRLRRWLQFVRACFVHESMLLARRRGPFPELRSGDLFASLAPRYNVAEARRLLRNRLLRHRHLLAFSPLSVIPRVDACEQPAEWIGLIPAIGCADAITMRGADIRHRLTIKQWERLLQLTGAVATNAVSCGHKQLY
jgi:hypothetical protein